MTLKAGYENIKIQNPAHAAYDTATNYGSFNGLPITAVVAGYYAVPLTQKITWVGANYQLTPQWEVSGAFYHRTDSAYGNNAVTTSGSSDAKYYSLMASYAFSKRTNWYATYNTTKTTGPAWENAGGTATMPNLTSYSTGIVHRF